MDGIEQYCPPAVIERVAKTDLGADADEALFSWLAVNADLRCQVHALIEVAGRMDAGAHVATVVDFCSSAATYARFLSDFGRAQVREAYLRMTYDPVIHFAWFMGLRLNRIDIREKMRGRIIEDWTFSHPRRDAETWQYYLYLASMDEPGAYEKLSAKMAATENGNDATNLLKSFAELGTPRAREILLTYADDPRQAEGPEELELPISETIKLLLARFF
jgi:hypothetical protein